MTARRIVSLVPGATEAVLALGRAAVLERLDPSFSAGHWNPELVEAAGGLEVVDRAGEPSRTLGRDEVVAA